MPGSIGLPNALDVLIDAAKLLQGDPIGIVMVGDGLERERLVRRIADEGLQDRVIWSPPIPKGQVPDFLARLDVAYIGWQKVPIYRFGMTNKLMDYLMARCVVLHWWTPATTPVLESGCGLTVPPE